MTKYMREYCKGVKARSREDYQGYPEVWTKDKAIAAVLRDKAYIRKERKLYICILRPVKIYPYIAY